MIMSHLKLIINHIQSSERCLEQLVGFHELIVFLVRCDPFLKEGHHRIFIIRNAGT